jgi:hypothetical protein
MITDRLYSFLFALLEFVIPVQYRSNELVFVRAAACAFTPPVYILVTSCVFVRYPPFQPPYWMMALYFLAPFSLRITGSYRVAAYIFLTIQFGTSVGIHLGGIVPSRFILGTTAVFVPFVRYPLVPLFLFADDRRATRRHWYCWVNERVWHCSQRPACS